MCGARARGGGSARRRLFRSGDVHSLRRFRLDHLDVGLPQQRRRHRASALEPQRPKRRATLRQQRGGAGVGRRGERKDDLPSAGEWQQRDAARHRRARRLGRQRRRRCGGLGERRRLEQHRSEWLRRAAAATTAAAAVGGLGARRRACGLRGVAGIRLGELRGRRRRVADAARTWSVGAERPELHASRAQREQYALRWQREARGARRTRQRERIVREQRRAARAAAAASSEGQRDQQRVARSRKQHQPRRRAAAVGLVVAVAVAIARAIHHVVVAVAL